MSHTKGPWIAQPDPHAMLRDDYVIGTENGGIDAVATCSAHDAHLIAAAPELLAALEAILRETKVTVLNSTDPNPMDIARAAIDKATKP